MDAYEPEAYWSRVAREVGQRRAGNVVAGEDSAFFRHKRAKFLRRFLDTLDLEGKSVLEVGCGPGGNLLHMHRRAPRRLVGADISQDMLDLAAANLAQLGNAIELRKTDGIHLPFGDREFNLTLSVTVLQHNLDESTFEGLVDEMCRVTRHRLVLIEDTDSTEARGETVIRRPVGRFEAICARSGFRLVASEYLNTRASLLAHRAIVAMWGVAFGYRFKEGEPVPRVLRGLLAVGVTLARTLDGLLPGRSGLTRMQFTREVA